MTLLYSGNAWLDKNSLGLMAVCTDKATAVKLATEAAEYTDEPLTIEQQNELLIHGQTYGRDENFMICAVNVDEII